MPKVYIKKGRYTPACVQARLRGAEANRRRKFIHDKTSVSVDKSLKYAVCEIYGNVHNALMFAVEHKDEYKPTEKEIKK